MHFSEVMAEVATLKIMKYERYTTTWSEEDGEYVGLCADFPSLSYLAPTKEEALRGTGQLVREVRQDMNANRGGGLCGVGLW